MRKKSRSKNRERTMANLLEVSAKLSSEVASNYIERKQRGKIGRVRDTNQHHSHNMQEYA